MLNNKLFKSLIFSVILIGILNFLAVKFHLFWTLHWFDILMHFLGGFLSGLFFVFLFIKKTRYLSMLLGVILFALFVGIVWEIFELYVGVTIISSFEYLSDTGMDIVMDLFGAFVSVIYSYKKLNEK